MSSRSSVLSLSVYVAVAATLVGGIGIALTAVTISVTSEQSVARAKTPFEIQLDSAREVREALAKPIPAPEPLPKITAKLEKPLAKVVVATRSAPPKRNSEVAMRESRRAFASIEPSAPPQSFFEFMAFGPRR